MSKVITLIAAGYVNCVAGDIGKQVQDDAAEIGALLGYNNTTREWWIDTALAVISGSAMTITAGTGAGTSQTAYYCTIADVKGSLRITAATWDAEIEAVLQDAGYFIDDILSPHVDVPLTGTIPNGVSRANKYLAAAMWKRLNPTSESDKALAKVYWEQGMLFIDGYIKYTYKTAQAKT